MGRYCEVGDANQKSATATFETIEILMAVLKLTQVTIPVNERVHWKTKKRCHERAKITSAQNKERFFPTPLQQKQLQLSYVI